MDHEAAGSPGGGSRSGVSDEPAIARIKGEYNGRKSASLGQNAAANHAPPSPSPCPLIALTASKKAFGPTAAAGKASASALLKSKTTGKRAEV